MDPRVLNAMLPFYLSRYGNCHSRTHLFDWESENDVEAAHSQVASLISATSKEIIFTSSATKSNNISIKGVLNFYKDKKRHVITTQTEHKCILETCRHLQQEGFEVTYLPMKFDCIIELDQLRSAIRPNTGPVSVMAVNTGCFQFSLRGLSCNAISIHFFKTQLFKALGTIFSNNPNIKKNLENELY